jgi:hypothetical protein
VSFKNPERRSQKMFAEKQYAISLFDYALSRNLLFAESLYAEEFREERGYDEGDNLRAFHC